MWASTCSGNAKLTSCALWSRSRLTFLLKVLIIGSGPDEKRFRELATDAAPDRVILPRFLVDKRIVRPLDAILKTSGVPIDFDRH